jgi:uncharacterized membrane protein
MPLTRASRIALFALVLLSMLLRLLFLDRGALAHDEPFTAYWSQQPLARFWAMLAEENNPPLHFLITRWWSMLVPFEASWLRVPSAISSGLVVWPLFLIAHHASGLRAATIAAVMFIFCSHHQGFAQEARAYALFTLLATLSMWLHMRVCRPTSRSALLLAVVNVLLVYTHFFGWLVVGLQGLMVLALPAMRPHWRAWARAAAFTAVLFSPYIVIFLQRAQAAVAGGTWLQAPSWEEPYNMIWRWSNAPVIAIAFIGLIAASFVRKPGNGALRNLAAIWALVPLTTMFAVSFWIPVFHDRYLVFAAPGFALLAAAGIEGVKSGPGVRWGLAGITAIAMAITFEPNRKRYAPEGVVELAARLCGNECSLQVAPSWYWLNYLAASDSEQLRQDQRHLLQSGIFIPDNVQAEALGPTVLIDATGGTGYAGEKAALRARYARIDSVEADHQVWLYRFMNSAQTARP